MNLYLLRHGLAVEPGTAGFENDADRPLTPEGKRKLRDVAKAMRALDVSFDVILSSPLVRARQTAEVVAKAFKAGKRLRLNAALGPGVGSERVLAALRRLKPTPEDLLLVGHEPDLSELISFMVAGDLEANFQLKKAGLAKLSAAALKSGRCATLEWLLTPGQLCRMAG